MSMNSYEVTTYLEVLSMLLPKMRWDEIRKLDRLLASVNTRLNKVEVR